MYFLMTTGDSHIISVHIILYLNSFGQVRKEDKAMDYERVNKETVAQLLKLEPNFMNGWAKQLGLVCGLCVEVAMHLERKKDYEEGGGLTSYTINDVTYPVQERINKLEMAINVIYTMTKRANKLANENRLPPVLPNMGESRKTVVWLLRSYGESRGDILLDTDLFNDDDD